MKKRLPEDIINQARRLISENRRQCLWFIREDYYPEDKEGLLKILTYIERYGDREAYKKTRDLKQWLLQITSEISAG